MSRLQLLLCEAERDPAMDPYILVIILTLSGGDQHVKHLIHWAFIG